MSKLANRGGTPKNKNAEITNKMSLTPEMRAISERAAAQDTEWFTIREDELTDFDMQHNPFNITERNYPEANKLQKRQKYAFRWCERKDHRIDELTRAVNPPLRWAIVTRTTLPEMERHIDPILGCVVCRDQILLFKPWAHHMIVKRSKLELAQAKDMAGSAEAVALRNADPSKIKPVQGEEARINSGDSVVYVDKNKYDGENTGIDDVVVDN